ncbi:uncharacterized protein BO97DRAFT_443554 [Aspergillus homomorphus CBS 101889]|uniref:Uncharacterized protein n=1 Tax=Aspergillus homomorphus (strain CBS 101889) TaxID=1450537 RepID=A0A395HVL4_ASPHC|nr:hypothetical protein BO97DRAFT_443554 [Aspergillus homomorphus CBS 101889]RAL11840.1 hypothetical protein BO97DRAFT_443554 [Aspergillus homomorphus CBS 101889]
MRPTQPLIQILTLAATLTLHPLSAHALLGTSCLSAITAMQELPLHIIQNVQTHACAAGCQPKLSHWTQFGKQAVLEPVVADGAARCSLPDGQAAMVDYLDAVYRSVEAQCQDFLAPRSHFCDDPGAAPPAFMDCARREVNVASARELPRLARYINEESCSKVEAYARSAELWDVDLPRRLGVYVERCHEL